MANTAGKFELGYEIFSGSPDDTMAWGKTIGELIDDSLIIALVGDLGSGKTVFVKGLAKGLGVLEGYLITSPSYTLINEYPGRLRLLHADLYRLSGSVDIESTGLFDCMNSGSVVAVEWAERLSNEDLDIDLQVSFDFGVANERKVSISGYGQKAKDLLRELGNLIK